VNNKSQILVVDDDDSILHTIEMLLEDQFDVATSRNEYNALAILGVKDFEVAIVDLVMPNISGLEMLQRIKEMKPSTEVIMVTGHSSVETVRQTLKSGAFDYIEKPFCPKELQRRIREAIEYRKEKQIEEEEKSRLLNRVRILEREIDKLRANSYQDMVELLSEVVGIQHNYTKQHLKSVEEYTIPIADKLHLSEEEKEDLKIAAALHDIGKLAVDESILNKTEPLTDSDWIQLRSHPEDGARIVETINEWREAAKGVRYHHEWLDGTGYPAGLKGDEIPLLARIVFVTDAFDAMTSDRSYREAMTESEAIDTLKQCRGSQFDPEVVNAFVDTVSFN